MKVKKVKLGTLERGDIFLKEITMDGKPDLDDMSFWMMRGYQVLELWHPTDDLECSGRYGYISVPDQFGVNSTVFEIREDAKDDLVWVAEDMDDLRQQVYHYRIVGRG